MNPITVATYSVGNKNLTALYENETPLVQMDGREFRSLEQLVNAVPQLSAKDELETFVKIANFLASGFEFLIINDPSQGHPHQPDAFGEFDFSKIKPPRIEGAEAVFYVQRGQNGVPYQVRCPWPYEVEPPMKYEMLPYV